MKKIRSISMKILLVFVLILGLVGCSSNKGIEKTKDKGSEKTIRIVCVEGMEPVVTTCRPYFEKQGYDVEIILVDLNVNILKAIQDGSADAGLGVHKKFMEQFNNENKGTLKMADPYGFSSGMAIYSDKYKSIEELPEGTKMSIISDAMNQDRGLKILRDNGIITLKDVDGLYKILDVDENPKKIEFFEMDQTQTVRSLDDMDAAVIFFSHMFNSNRDFNDYLVRDKNSIEYPVGYVFNPEAKNNPENVEKLLSDALYEEEVKEFVKDHFKGLYTYLDEEG